KETENKETENLYAHLRFYQDRDNNPALKRSVSCTGMSCKLKTKFADIPIFDPGDFLPIDGNGDYNADDVHVVLPHRGIYLTLDSSGNNAIGAPLSFGAWMDRAGFFVAPGGTFVRNNGAKNTARMVVAAGELTGSPPAVNAVWRGSMVGTVLEGDAKDHILRGDAELTFDMSNATLDAHFFNIRDYDSFGAPHMVEDAQGGPKNSLRFANIPVAADGRYVKSYGFRDHISGAFYGEGHAETAGTFERKPNSIIGAFGAKQVTRN
ncbi:MAG: hypothetical protein GDA41_12670, partial [Rhodospirillales bacterium]|nr:hypothetical protein [Rhodospirillales bacterium]